MRKLALLALVSLLATPLVPGAEAATPSDCAPFVEARMPDEAVTPRPGAPDDVVTGTFDTSVEGAYVMVPFEVPPGQKRVQLRLCHDQPDPPTSSAIAHTLDLGLYEPARDGFWDTDEFRGWGGSSRPEVVLTPQGDNDEGDGPADGASTTVGYLPGRIPKGTWAAEIGVAAVVGPDEGDPDGEVAWRLEIYTGDDPADADEPWRPERYDEGPAVSEAGWYKGDFHVHARHSNPHDALMSEVFDYAFRERGEPGAEEGAGLDFITLSDYVTARHWDEIGRFQGHEIPGDKLVIRSSEVITYEGHVNNHASGTHVDHRTGPVYEWPDLTEPIRGERSPNAIFDAIHASGTGWTQINHPTTFPAAVPGFDSICRGCSWEHDDTDWSKVDAFEVQTGPAGYTEPKGNEPGPNPFTPLAIEWFDRLRREGHDITAVGVSDSHHADHEELTQSPIGEATTVVFAPELSEAGIREGVIAGHAYVKFFSSDGPDLRLEARGDPGSAEPDAIMGDEVDAPAWLTAEVFFEAEPRYASPQPRTLLVLRDGAPILALPVGSTPFEITVPAVAPGDYRLQLQRGTAIEALTNPITISD